MKEVVIHNDKEINYETKNKKGIIIFFIATTFLAIAIRIFYRGYQSNDYLTYLKRWINFYKNNGGISSIAKNISDYNIPYQVILAIISYFPINYLYAIKVVSIFFDFVIAIFAYLIVKKLIKIKKNDDIYIPIITYLLVLFLPTVVLNSSAWGQCDSIYTAFVLISLYFMIQDKSIISFIFLGIAFSFKLQFIFILPLYLLLCLKNKNFNIFEFLIIPAVNYIMCIPAFIYGKSFKSVTMIYFNQANEYKTLTANMANIYTFFPRNSNTIVYAGILFTFIVILSIVIFYLRKNIKLEKSDYIAIGLLMVMIEVFFLPRMHERYLYMADVLSVIYYMINKKNIIIPIIVNFVSFHGYIYCLYIIRIIDSRSVALVYFIAIIYLMIITYKDISEKNLLKISAKN